MPPKHLRPEDSHQDNPNIQEQKSVENRGKQIMKVFQGDIGERCSIPLATQGMGWKPELDFERTRRGFDGVFRDNDNKLIIVETKTTEKSGERALGKGQMTVAAIDKIAEDMQNPYSKDYYTVGNAKIGAEIKKVGAENVRRFLFWLEPTSLEWKVYERQANDVWHEVKTFDATDPTFDGPCFE